MDYLLGILTGVCLVWFFIGQKASRSIDQVKQDAERAIKELMDEKYERF